jgi:hypothetical protein
VIRSSNLWLRPRLRRELAALQKNRTHEPLAILETSGKDIRRISTVTAAKSVSNGILLTTEN